MRPVRRLGSPAWPPASERGRGRGGRIGASQIRPSRRQPRDLSSAPTSTSAACQSSWPARRPTARIATTPPARRGRTGDRCALRSRIRDASRVGVEFQQEIAGGDLLALAAATWATRPANGAHTGCSIFIASSTSSPARSLDLVALGDGQAQDRARHRRGDARDAGRRCAGRAARVLLGLGRAPRAQRARRGRPARRAGRRRRARATGAVGRGRAHAGAPAAEPGARAVLARGEGRRPRRAPRGGRRRRAAAASVRSSQPVSTPPRSNAGSAASARRSGRFVVRPSTTTSSSAARRRASARARVSPWTQSLASSPS